MDMKASTYIRFALGLATASLAWATPAPAAPPPPPPLDLRLDLSQGNDVAREHDSLTFVSSKASTVLFKLVGKPTCKGPPKPTFKVTIKGDLTSAPLKLEDLKIERPAEPGGECAVTYEYDDPESKQNPPKKKRLKLVFKGPAKDNDEVATPVPLPDVRWDGKAFKPNELPVGGASVKLTVRSVRAEGTAAATPKTTITCEAGDGTKFAKELPASADEVPDATFELPLSDARRLYTCSAQGATASFKVVRQEPTPACAETNLEPNAAEKADLLKAGHKCGAVEDNVATLCLAPSGGVIGDVPDLNEGRFVRVRFFQRSNSTAKYEFDARFERTKISGPQGKVKGYDEKGDVGYTWVVVGERLLKLSGKGKLRVKVTRTGEGVETFRVKEAAGQKDYQACTVKKDDEGKETTLDVAGRYHFMAGLMAAYLPLKDRAYTVSTSDDGVARIQKQDGGGFDIVLNLSAYPSGVDDDQTSPEVGVVLGTALNSVGNRWFLGPEIAWPVGFGMSAGVAAVRVPALDRDLVEGQPFVGTTAPTHNTVKLTGYVGVNLEAELFRRVFAALFENDKGSTP